MVRIWFSAIAAALLTVGATTYEAGTASQPPVQRQNTLEQAVANLGARCYPGDSFDSARSDSIPGSTPQTSGTSTQATDDFSAAVSTGSRLNQLAQSGAQPPRPPELTATSDFAELSTLADIERVIYRKLQSEIILIGPPAEDNNGLRFDDWVAVLRSVSKFGSPAVSIDPGNTPSEMKVRYIGGIEHSHLGVTFFEADRTLKLLSTGFDNLNCAPWLMKPKDLLTQLDLMDGEMRAGPSERGWHRFWFEPTNETVKEDPAVAGSIRIEQQRLAVLDESIPPGTSSASAEQFSATISKRFLELTGQIPAFAQLQRQAALIALAKWMVDRGVPADRKWLEGTPTATDTPDITPSITVMRATLLDQGYLRYGIHGGVDFQKPNKYSKEVGVARPVTAALQVRQPNSRTWPFTYGGKRYRAVALKIRNPVSMSKQMVTWQRLTIPMPQPGLEQLAFPSGYVRGLGRLIIKNDDLSSSLMVRVSGPTVGTYMLAPQSQTSIGVQPGAYELLAMATCGSRTDKVNLTDGAVNQQSYNCTIRR